VVLFWGRAGVKMSEVAIKLEGVVMSGVSVVVSWGAMGVVMVCVRERERVWRLGILFGVVGFLIGLYVLSCWGTCRVLFLLGEGGSVRVLSLNPSEARIALFLAMLCSLVSSYELPLSGLLSGLLGLLGVDGVVSMMGVSRGKMEAARADTIGVVLCR
jgi:hypothetical protein